ncbi:MAG: hypothetical protein C5B59_11085 [Bacteroidetes bacterium]|nr:MAG: hypothetical protein C5B59_11085 [Bacteroidota bacterium]
MKSKRLKTICLRPHLLIAFLFLCPAAFSQDLNINQDINTITVKGVTFNQVVSRLLSHGYAIKNLDNKNKTVHTSFSKCKSKTAVMNISLNVHVRDSVAIITGKMCYNLNNNQYASPDSARTSVVKYTRGAAKEAFLEMDSFAKSFKSEMIYSKTYY